MQDLFEHLNDREREILEKRARALARPAIKEEERDSDLIEVLVFSLNRENYAIPITYVLNVRPLERWTRVPGTPSFVTGVINMRGNILSIVDLRQFLGRSPLQMDDQLMIVIVESSQLQVGLLVNHIKEVTRIHRSQLKPPPESTGNVEADYFEGVTSDRVVLLKIETILNDPHMIVQDEVF